MANLPFHELLDRFGSSAELFLFSADEINLDYYDIKSVCSDDEMTRFNETAHIERKNCIGASYLMLRTLLAKRLRISSIKVSFDRNEHGKPYLSDSHRSNIEFSLSRSGSRFLIAISKSAKLGVDLESVSGCLIDLSSSFRAWHKREIAIIQRYPRFGLQTLLHRMWSLKEAVVKNIGCGLSLEPDRIDTSGFFEQYRDSEHLRGFLKLPFGQYFADQFKIQDHVFTIVFQRPDDPKSRKPLPGGLTDMGNNHEKR